MASKLSSLQILRPLYEAQRLKNRSIANIWDNKGKINIDRNEGLLNLANRPFKLYEERL
jgi:hypothetical protein